MRDSSGVLWRTVRSADPVAVVLYRDLASRDDLVELIQVLAPPDRVVRRSEEIEELFGGGYADEIIVVTPTDEAAAVAALESRRDTLQDREMPAILFLLQGGKGVRQLQDSPALTSWLRGRIIDPEQLDRLDTEVEQKRFEADTGTTPDQWLLEWDRGERPDTLENNLLLHRALLLQGSK